MCVWGGGICCMLGGGRHIYVNAGSVDARRRCQVSGAVVIGSCMWVLGHKLGSSARALCTLNN